MTTGREAGPRPVHGQVCYLQLPADDVAHCAQFYVDVFGWEFGMHGGSEFSAPGMIGQFDSERRVAAGDDGPLLWICVDGLDDALAQAQVHGGLVVDQPYQDGGGRRWLATVRDPAGSLVGLVQMGAR
jgi:predicted enzyme related to lactoylglutathione lyase